MDNGGNNSTEDYFDTSQPLKDYYDSSQPLKDTTPHNNFIGQMNESQQTLRTGNDSFSRMMNSSQANDSFSAMQNSISTLQAGNCGGAQPLKDAQHAMQLLGSYIGSSAPLKDYLDTSAPLKGYKPASGKDQTDGKDDDSTDTFDYKFDPTRRRKSSAARRRSTLGRDNRSATAGNNSLKSKNSMKSDTSSLRMSGLEPGDVNDGSISLSFLSAQKLGKALDDNMSFNSLGASGQWGIGNSNTTGSKCSRASVKNSLDASMLSLMSMSLSEIAQENLPAANAKSSSPSGNAQRRHSESDDSVLKKHPPALKPLEVTVEKKVDHGESIMSLGASYLGASLDNDNFGD